MIDSAFTYTAKDLRAAFFANRKHYPTIRHVDDEGYVYPVVRGIDSSDYDRLIRDAMQEGRAKNCAADR